MKTVIYYATRYGATKQYVDWLAAEAGADVFKFTDFSKSDLNNYDTIIVASGTYAGRMPLTKFLKQHWNEMKGKKVGIMAIGGIDADNLWSKISYWLVPGRIRRRAMFYHKLPGAVGDENAPEPESMKEAREFKPTDFSRVKKEELKPVLDGLKKATT